MVDPGEGEVPEDPRTKADGKSRQIKSEQQFLSYCKKSEIKSKFQTFGSGFVLPGGGFVFRGGPLLPE